MQTPIPIDLFALGRLPLLPGAQIPLGSTPGVLTFADILQRFVTNGDVPDGTVDSLSAILAEYPVSDDTAVEDLFALHKALSNAVIEDGALAGLSLPAAPLFEAVAAVQDVIDAIQPATGEHATTATLVTQLFDAIVQTVTTDDSVSTAIQAAIVRAGRASALQSTPEAAPATDTRLAAAIVERLVGDASLSLTPEQRADVEAAVARLVHLLDSGPAGRQALASNNAAPGRTAADVLAANPSPASASSQHSHAPAAAPPAQPPLLAALRHVVLTNTASAPAQAVDAAALRDGVTVPELLTSLVRTDGATSVGPLPQTPVTPGTPQADVSSKTPTVSPFLANTLVPAEPASDKASAVLTILEERVAVLRSARQALAPLDRDAAPPAPKADANSPSIESLLTTFGQVLGSRTASIGAGATAATAAAQATLVDLPDQVVQHVQFLASKDGGIAQLQLQPPALGRLTVHVIQDHDLVTVKLHAQSQQVREVLQGQMNHLKQQFSDQGLQLVELSIHVDTGQQRGAAEDREAFAALHDRIGRASGATRAGPLTTPLEPIGPAPAEPGRLNLIA